MFLGESKNAYRAT